MLCHVEFFLVVELVGGGSVINKANPSRLKYKKNIYIYIYLEHSFFGVLSDI